MTEGNTGGKSDPAKRARWKPVLLGTGREEIRFSCCLIAILTACLLFTVITGGDWAHALSDRIEQGKSPKLEHFIHSGCWWSALAGGCLAFLLWGTRKIWYFESERVSMNSRRMENSRAWYAWVFLILLFSLFVRWPRMDLSFYNDEADTFIRYIGGNFHYSDKSSRGAVWDLEEDSMPDFHQQTWATTFWGNKQANNHVLYSVLARACYSLDLMLGNGVPGEIREIPLRLPALIGGLLSILLVALILKELGRPRAAVFAAAFLAMHPWHLRFSTEARGYGLLFGLMMLAVYFLVRAIKENQWKWWIAYGLAQSIYLYACLAGVYHAVAINAATLLFWASDQWTRSGGLRQLKSWDWRPLKALVVANVFSLGFFLLLLGPGIPQISRATKNIGIFKKGMSSDLWVDVLSYLAFGMPWVDGDPDNRYNPAVTKWLPGVVMIAGILVVLLLVCLGIRAWWKSGGPGRVILAGAAGSGLLVFVINSITGGTVLTWYLSYLIPVMGMILGLGLDELLQLRRRPESGRMELRSRVLLYGTICVYAFVVMKPVQRYRAIGKQALKESIQTARGGVHPLSEEEKRPITAGWWTNADIYDPYFKIAYQMKQIRFLMNKADSEERPFYFILGHYSQAKKEDEDVVNFLENSGEFDLVKVFPGLEEIQYRQYVFRYRGKKVPN